MLCFRCCLVVHCLYVEILGQARTIYIACIAMLNIISLSAVSWDDTGPTSLKQQCTLQQVHFVRLIHSTTSATPACSAPDPEALLEALLARKLTAKMLVDAGKGQAQKWINDKLTPKESLLASMGAEDHDFMVILLTSNTVSMHIMH